MTTTITQTSTQEQIFNNHKVSLNDVNITAWNTLERYTLDTFLVSDYYQEVCAGSWTCTVENGESNCSCVSKSTEFNCCDGFDGFISQCQKTTFNNDESALDSTNLNPCNVDSFTIGLFYHDLTEFWDDCRISDNCDLRNYD